MLTIIRKNLLLTINDNVIPAMGSSDVPVKFINDTETYVGFLIEPRVGSVSYTHLDIIITFNNESESEDKSQIRNATQADFDRF